MLWLCILLVLLTVQPSKSDVSEVLGPSPFNSSTASVIWEIAHRASTNEAPENTLEAVRFAAYRGAKCIEFDVSFTVDNVAVAFHDDTLDRVTTATGPISEKTYQELIMLDLSVKHPTKITGVRIPTVDQFVSLCLSLDLTMIIDLKAVQQNQLFAIEGFKV